MQEAPPAPATPTGRLNSFTWYGMIAASLSGTVLCFISFCLSWDGIRYSGVTIKSYENRYAVIDKPGKPWLCFAVLILAIAFVIESRRLYQVATRRKIAFESTSLVAKVTAAGGLMFFAGAESNSETLLLGPCLMAYAGIGYLAYTRLDRVRAQLYRD